MTGKMVWVGRAKRDGSLRIVRIFKSRRAAAESMWSVRRVPYAQAVQEIRHQIFVRSEGFCEICMVRVLETSGHMHEKIHRGKGGEISLDNSIFICPTCHNWEHADRNPRFTKKTVDSM
jgi:5-methylcytosine-specific restriction endonuclease McrA